MHILYEFIWSFPWEPRSHEEPYRSPITHRYRWLDIPMLRAFLYFFVLWVFGWSNRELQDFDVCKIRPIFGPWRNGDLLYATGTRGLTVVELLPKSQTASLRFTDDSDLMMTLTTWPDMMTRSVKTGESAKKNSFILISSVSIPAQISLRDHHDDMMKLDLVAIGVSHGPVGRQVLPSGLAASD